MNVLQQAEVVVYLKKMQFGIEFMQGAGLEMADICPLCHYKGIWSSSKLDRSIGNSDSSVSFKCECGIWEVCLSSCSDGYTAWLPGGNQIYLGELTVQNND